MVPEDFTNFFLGTAGVSGALIGLLFVAISVAPERRTPLTKLQFDLRAAKAFTVFSNALVISLIALIPKSDIGSTAIVVGAVSVASCVALVILTLTEAPSGYRRTELARIGVQGAVFVYEIVVGVQVMGTTGDQNGVGSLATLVVVLFLIGMARSWQLLGARDTGLLTLVMHQLRSPAGADGSTGAHDGDAD
jgi:hypothetical protein